MKGGKLVSAVRKLQREEIKKPNSALKHNTTIRPDSNDSAYKRNTATGHSTSSRSPLLVMSTILIINIMRVD